MCGRARCSLSREEVAAYAKLEGGWAAEEEGEGAEAWEPRYNTGPGSSLPVLRKGKDGSLQPRLARWGLIPSFTKLGEGQKPDFFRMFNARSESVPDKPIFSRLLTAHRCIVLLNGFYEWKQEHQGKQPFYVHLEGEPLMAMAGLADSCRDPERGRPLESCTILTTDSSPRLEWRALHNRMPVLLRTPEAREAWLSNEPLTTEQLGQLCRPYNGEDLAWHPVTPAMGKIGFQGPECCRPLKKQTISTFFKPLKGADPAAQQQVKSGAAAAAGPSAKAEGGQPSRSSAAEASSVPVERGATSDVAVARAEGTLPTLKEDPAGDIKEEPRAAREGKLLKSEPEPGAEEKQPRSGQKRLSSPPKAPSASKKARPVVSPKGTIDSFFIKNSKSLRKGQVLKTGKPALQKVY